MLDETGIVLGISLGTSCTGIAAMRGKELIEWNIHSFKNAWSTQKLQHILSKVETAIARYKPKRVGLKMPLSSSASTALTELHTAIVKLLATKNIEYRTYTIHDILKRCPLKSKASDLGKALFEEYKELAYVYKRQQESKRRYQDRAFEAICVALLIGT